MESDEIKVEVGRLGDEVRTYLIRKGTTVRDVLNMSGIDGDAHTVKIGGIKVAPNTVINEPCSMVAVTETEYGY